MVSCFEKITLSLYGASHAPRVGCVLGGLPVGERINEFELQAFLDRRKSGKYLFSTPRIESDRIVFSRGLVDGVIRGEVEGYIENQNTRPSDYSYATTPRPSHADYVSILKLGADGVRSGGGAFSGRMTAPLCIAGGLAKQLLEKRGIFVAAYISKVASIGCRTYNDGIPNYKEIVQSHDYALPIPNTDILPTVVERLNVLSRMGDSAGGVIECVAYGLPVGLGDGLYGGLEGRLSLSLYAIPAVKSVESGLGKEISDLCGSQANDPFCYSDGQVVTSSNHSGGINGGITNGMPVTIRVGFRPTPSISLPQKTVDLATGKETEIVIKGRHDVCFLPRAVAAVESAVALVLLDCMIENQLL